MRTLPFLIVACLLIGGLASLAQDAPMESRDREEPGAVVDQAAHGPEMPDLHYSMEIGFEWTSETVVRGEREYTRLVPLSGGVEPGPDGSEVVFYQYTFTVAGEISSIDVRLRDPVNTKAGPLPAIVPQRIGSGIQVLDPRWDTAPGTVTASWKLTRTSDVHLDGGDGAMYSLKVYPAEYRGDGATIYTKAEVVYAVEPAAPAPAPARGDPGHKPTGDIKYLIITHDSLVEALEPLAEWKSQKGLFTQIVTTTELDAQYTGADKAEKMRKHVASLEEEHDLKYLLIVGDWNLVPTRNTKNSYYQGVMGEPDNFASDLYFACVDNGTSWNKDGDVYFAEENELDDAVPDLAVGRLAINNATQLGEVLDDLLAREKNLSWDGRSNVSVYMAGDPGAIPGDPTAFMDHLWTTYGLDSYAGRQTLYYDNSSSMDFNQSNFKQVIDDRYQTVNYYAHGECTGIPGLFHNNNVSSLAENGSDGAFFAMACNTGWFDNPNQGDMGAVPNCFGEMLTETPKKGVAGYIGSSRIAVGDIDTTYSADAPGLQEDFCKASQQAVDGTLEPTTGVIWQTSVTQFSNSFTPFTAQMFDNPGLRTFLEYNLLGEPDAPLVFRPPQQLNMSFVVSGGEDSVWAKVTNDTGAPVAGADVAIFRKGELGRSGVTNATGEVNIAIPPNNGGVINITASRSGDIPDQDSFIIDDDLAPHPMYSILPAAPDGDSGYYVTPPVITMFADEDALVEYRWDGGSIKSNQTQAVSTAPEGNHTLEFRVKDATGHSSLWIPVATAVDTVPPVLTLQTDPALPDGENGYFTSLPTLTLLTDEPLQLAEYRIDDGYFREYNNSVVLKEGEEMIFFQGFDIAGNKNTANLSFKIDLSPETTILNISHQPDGLNGYYVTRPQVEVVCTYDPAVLVEYKWNDGDWNTYTEPLGPPEGINLLYHRGTDPAGNIEAEKNWTFKVDTVKPVVNATVEPAYPDGSGGIYRSNPVVTITTNEGDRRYVFKEPGAVMDLSNPREVLNNTNSWTGPITVPEGDWRMFIAAVDIAGNVGQAPPLDLEVDVTGPSFTYRIEPSAPDGANDWYTSPPKIHIESVPEDSVVYWAPSGSDNWTAASAFLTLDQSGVHDIRLKGVDHAGNVYLITLDEIKVDLAEPSVSIGLPMESEVYGGIVEVDWTGSDPVSGIDGYEVKVDGGQWRKNGNKTQYLIYSLETGGHHVSVKALDAAGNEGIATRVFTVDSSPPQIRTRSPEGSGVSINAVVEVEFNKEMDRDTVVVIIEGVGGSLSWIGSKAVFTPNAPLDHITTYNVSVSGYDIYNNPLGTVDWTFTTEYVEQEEEDPDESSGSLLYIVIAVIAVLVILAVVVLVVISRRKKTLDEAEEIEEEEEEEGPDEDDEEDEYEDDDYEEDDDEDGEDDDDHDDEDGEDDDDYDDEDGEDDDDYDDEDGEDDDDHDDEDGEDDDDYEEDDEYE